MEGEKTLARRIRHGILGGRRRIVGLIERLSLRFLGWAERKGADMTARRMAQGQVRSLWGVTPILTLPLKARCDELLGITSETAVWTTYVVTKAFDWNLKWLVAICLRIDPALLFPLGRVVLGIALLRYDIFHFFNDRALSWPTRRFGIEPAELELYARAGKPAYVFVYGADIRTRQRTLELGKWNFCSDCPEPTRFCVCDDTVGSEHMARTAERATAVVAMGDMIAYAPEARNMHYWPIDTRSLQYVGVSRADGPLRIAHAPNHMHFKGSRYLEEAVERLKGEGHAIELLRVSGVPNTEVLRLFAEADIVADQFIGGAYGYTALEGMARGKPVLCYIRHDDMIMAHDECPLIQTRPETIEAVLRWCLANRSILPAIGKQGRLYVEKHHALESVAGRLAALYRQSELFPEIMQQRFRDFIATEAKRQQAITCSDDWRHPFAMTAISAHEARLAIGPN